MLYSFILEEFLIKTLGSLIQLQFLINYINVVMIYKT